MKITRARTLLALLLATTAFTQTGCFTLAATGVAVGALAAVDRRTLGAQTEDEAIELKIASRVRGFDSTSAAVPGRVAVASYNRKVLLVGQVPSDAARTRAEQVAAGVENVRSVHNELQVGPPASLTTQSSDTLVTGKVKASFLDAKDIQSNAIKVVTENGNVYLMGIVTAREADRAAQVASRVSGVRRVVTVFEQVSEDELGRIQRGSTGEGPAPRR